MKNEKEQELEHLLWMCLTVDCKEVFEKLNDFSNALCENKTSYEQFVKSAISDIMDNLYDNKDDDETELDVIQGLIDLTPSVVLHNSLSVAIEAEFESWAQS